MENEGHGKTISALSTYSILVQNLSRALNVKVATFDTSALVGLNAS